jgi:PiT family inorganic phosphate transporter
VRWHVANGIVVAWIVTIPAAAVMAAIMFAVAGLPA